MKNLKFYSSSLSLSGEEQIFNHFMHTLRPSIFDWSYFVDWEKVKANMLVYKTELNILNSLIGSVDIEKEFIELYKRYPEIKKALPILIALRNKKIGKIVIVDKELEKFFSVMEILQSDEESQLLKFFSETGLKDIFEDRTIKNLVDYVVGVEVGMDTNARKNRSGKLMEGIVEEFIQENSLKKGYEYGAQMTPAKIFKRWGIEVPLYKVEKKSKRIFDFIINMEGKLTMIEVNFYSGGGSKLKATAGEYIGLHKSLKQDDFDFVWITDGLGWEGDRLHLEEAFNQIDYIFNLDMIKQGVLDEVL
ncbi:type II restriction endonuclease [bacterium]|nr:type II restriction endonuclease [bacterium]